MTVYVDNPRYPFGRMLMCHMMADSLPELHEFAGWLGCKREWFQGGKRPHYDLSLLRRREALRLGAVEVSSRDLVRFSSLRFGSAYDRPRYRAQVRRIEKRSGGICEARICCNGAPAEGDPHHKWYNEEFVGPRRLDVPDEALVAVCRACHLHFERMKARGTPVPANGAEFVSGDW